MSQNRGYRGNRPPYQNYSGRGAGAVNPWEGGMVPGGQRSGLAGLLPTPNQNSALLPQLSLQEAQLAIANNLLTSLLRPQQQQTQVPPLLSLSGLGQLGPAQSGYMQSSYGQNQNRYNDHMNRRNKPRMDSRRSEPYNKLQQNRRSAPRGQLERKSGGGPGSSGPSTGKQRPGSDTKPDSREAKRTETDVSKEDETKESEEDSKRDDEDDGDSGKRREWKDEKKPEGEKETGKSAKEDRDTSSRYSGVPSNLFFCHICKKHMWDGQSFENHLKGRTHYLMMEKLEEGYRVKVELMRHELKLNEQQREIEYERMKRQGKKVGNMNIREYCTMCDLNFFGNLTTHRKNERHQALKNFLHPRCIPCDKEFPTRVEWDHHKLTPLHLRRTAEVRKNRKSGQDDDDEFTIEDFIPGTDSGSEQRDIQVRTRKEEEDELQANISQKDDSEQKSNNEDTKAKDDKVKKDDLDGPADGIVIPGLSFRIPKYNPDIPVGQDLLKKVTGYLCRSCQRFFCSEDEAKTHCRTLSHYTNFVEVIRARAKAKENRAKEIQAKEKQAKENQEKENQAKETQITKEESEVELAELEKAKRKTSDEDDGGNWKRRKVSNLDDEEDSSVCDKDSSVGDETKIDKSDTKETIEVLSNIKVEVEDSSNQSAKRDDGKEKYDPSDAFTEDSQDEPSAPVKDVPAADTNFALKSEDVLDEKEVWQDIDDLLDTVGAEVASSDTEKVSPAQDVRTTRRAGKAHSGTVSSPGGTATRGRGKRRK